MKNNCNKCCVPKPSTTANYNKYMQCYQTNQDCSCVQYIKGPRGAKGFTGPSGTAVPSLSCYKCADINVPFDLNFLDTEFSSLAIITKINQITYNTVNTTVVYSTTPTRADVIFSETGTNHIVSRVTTDTGNVMDITCIFEVQDCVPVGPAASTLFAVCHARGDAAIDQSTEPTIVKWDYTDNTNSGVGVTKLAFANETGSIWGLTYQKLGDVLFSAQRLKRYSIMLDDSSGEQIGESLYMTSDVSGVGPYTTVKFIDSTMIANFPKAGPNIAAERLPMEPFGPGNIGDPGGINRDGKFGLGGLTLSLDQKSLYFVNLYNRRLYKIPVGLAATPTVPTPYVNGDSRNSDVISIGFDTDIIDFLGLPAFTNAVDGNDIKFFAVKPYKNELFIGAVNSSYSIENSSFNTALLNLRLYVIAVNQSDLSSPRIVLDYDLNYERGQKVFPTRAATWRPWIDPATGGGISRRMIDNGETEAYLATFFNTVQTAIPFATGIEFDSNGFLNVSLEDMTANWFWEAAPDFVRREVDDGAPNYLSCSSAGDVIRAKPVGSIWVVDPVEYPPDLSAFAPPVWRADILPSGFYSLEYPGVGNHGQPFTGGITVLPTSNELVAGTIDAYTFNEGTTTTLTTTGSGIGASSTVYRRTLYIGSNLAFGKGNGLADFDVSFDCVPENECLVSTVVNPN